MPPSTAGSLHGEIAARLEDQRGDRGLTVKYSTPKAGSRARKDGVEVKWESSRPVSTSDPLTSSVHRTDFPFFCHDVTDRNIRVPFDDKEKTTHPCGAVGIAGVEVLFPALRFMEYGNLYTWKDPRVQEWSRESTRSRTSNL